MSEDMTHYEGDGCDAPDAHGRHRQAAEYLEQHKPVREAPLAGGGDRVLGAAAGWVALNVPFGDDRQVNARRAFVAGARWAEARRPAPSRPEDRGAEDLGSCSYLRGVGSCSFGCHSEPACITERPSGGWPSEPPPRDPAGEGEVAWWSCVLCGFSAAILCRGCRSARHMPAPRGATCSERHHEYQTPARPSSPTGETPCATCGGRGFYEFFNNHTGERDEEACPDCQPTGETAGQGEWRREEPVLPGMDNLIFYVNAAGERVVLPLAVEQAIRAETEAWVEGEWKAWTAADADKLRAAEAERDRLREALDVADHLAGVVGDRVAEFGGSRPHDAHVWHQMVEEYRRLRALAGESTGAGEGE